jgi:tetratricopeptide (TPR) repeat protein
MGQSLLQFLYLDKQYQSIHYILDDSEKLISNITAELHTLSTEKSKYLFNYLDFWSGYIERYRAVTLIAQKQYSGAIQHIFKSFQLNPYFPYSNYPSLKQDYTKKYGIDIIPGLNDVGEILDNKFDSSSNLNVSNQLKSQIEYDDIEFLYELVKDIISEAKSEDLNRIIISELQKLDKTNPFNFLSYAEVIKFIKKGDSMFQQIYIERIDESVSMLRSAIELDRDFPLIYTKIGVLLFIKGAHYQNDNFINEGMLEYKKGIHFMERLGIHQGASDPL